MSALVDPNSLELNRDGAKLLRCALSRANIEALQQAIQSYDQGRPGARLGRLGSLDAWLGTGGVVGQMVGYWLGPEATPVRAILFDKNPISNWVLGWHQDRTIAVSGRSDVTGFKNWNRKDGIDHVEPPFDLIERMVTVRIHLDAVSPDNAPLLISPGTNRLGAIEESRIAEEVARHGAFECLADVGDVWLYRTAILHASKRATKPARRRVLQVDYSADELPDPLSWFLRP